MKLPIQWWITFHSLIQLSRWVTRLLEIFQDQENLKNLELNSSNGCKIVAINLLTQIKNSNGCCWNSQDKTEYEAQKLNFWVVRNLDRKSPMVGALRKVKKKESVNRKKDNHRVLRHVLHILKEFLKSSINTKVKQLFTHQKEKMISSTIWMERLSLLIFLPLTTMVTLNIVG